MEGQIAATKAGKEELARSGIKEPGKNAPEEEWAGYNKALAATGSYKAAQQQWGTGSDIQRGIQASTAAIQGLAVATWRRRRAGRRHRTWRGSSTA
ncbi:hypothetical protein OJ965_20535 [Pantoea anthophila]|uniref:hypothetical protein n=1 Tax=Pantoea anthophila TaxID=470931 RepID=UPI001649C6AA|nr:MULTISPECIES: hypothetical protein [Pantoea]UZH03012.1 hypothetical protein OJ965_20535 [Pantoea anthophila]